MRRQLSQTFFQEAPRTTFNNFLMSILGDNFGVRELLHLTKSEIVTNQEIVTSISNSMVTETTLLGPIAKIVVLAVKVNVAALVKASCLLTLPVPSLLRLDSPSHKKTIKRVF